MFKTGVADGNGARPHGEDAAACGATALKAAVPPVHCAPTGQASQEDELAFHTLPRSQPKASSSTMTTAVAFIAPPVPSNLTPDESERNAK